MPLGDVSYVLWKLDLTRPFFCTSRCERVYITTPVAFAIELRLQCVALGGFSSSVLFTIRACFRWLIDGSRPLRGASLLKAIY